MATGQSPKVRKVFLRVAVEVDEQVWAEEYGVDVEDVNDDVKTYVQSTLQDSYAGQHLDVKVKVSW